MVLERLAPPPLPRWLEEQLPFDRYRVDLGAWRMHVMERGEGPTVLMLHGNPTWGFLYRKVALALGDGFRVVIPDLIGLGLSDKPHSGCAHTLDAHIHHVAALIEHLDLSDVTFVGQDWGGPIGLGAFVERRERLAGLVVLNTVLGPPKPDFRPTAFHRFARIPVVSEVAFRGLQFPQLDLGVAQGDPSSIRGSVGRAYRWPLRRFRDRQAPLALARMVPDSLQHPSVPALRRVHELAAGFDGPAEIVWGDRDPVLGRVFGHIQRTLPHARATRTQGGHFLQEEVPDAIADAVRRVAQAV